MRPFTRSNRGQMRAKWILLALFLTEFSAPASSLNVMLDPGHGGKDHGASAHGVFESSITLEVAKRLHDLLRKDKRFSVQMSRDQDASLTLYRRAMNSKIRKSDIFLSIHVNS